MKIVNVLSFIIILLCTNSGFSAAAAAAADDTYFTELPIIDTFMGNRRTNVGCHATLYPWLSMPLAVNCHPYNPTDVMGSRAPATASHPLVARYNPDSARDVLPEFIRARLDTAGATCQLFLNVQDNPWNGTPIQLRSHAFSDFFLAMGGNYAGVTALVCRGDGTALLNTTSSVHLHDGVASPSNFAIAGLDHTHMEDFYSIVAFGGRTVITRHILLTVQLRELFQGFLCTPPVAVVADAPAASVNMSLSFFSPLLGSDYATFLGMNGII